MRRSRTGWQAIAYWPISPASDSWPWKRGSSIRSVAGAPAAVQGSGQPVADLEELQAVADGDVRDGTALGREDDRDLLDRAAPAEEPDPGRGRAFFQGGEPGRIADAGHLAAQREADLAGQQPFRARPQHVGVDQLAEPAGDARLEPGGLRGLPSGGGQPPDGLRAPVKPPVAGDAAGQPPLLPGTARILRQPVQEPG